MKEPVVSIIIVSFNTREVTLDCLRSVFRETTETPFELIVFDNDSGDGSAEAIEAEFGDRVTLIRSPENKGFARANNAAAEDAEGEYLLLLNPDTVVLDGAIDRLVGFARRRPDAGIWGGRTLFADRSLNPASCWMRQTVWSLASRALGLASVFRGSSFFDPEGMGGWDRSSERSVDIVSGCFLLIRAELWNRLNGFDPRFFMYGEEADLCLRSRVLGAAPAISPDASIVHYAGRSEQVRANKMRRLLAAKSLLIRRHFPRSKIRLGLICLVSWPFTRLVSTALLRPFSRRFKEANQTWAVIWRTRNEWVRGEFTRS